jgi:hypothetical protein
MRLSRVRIIVRRRDHEKNSWLASGAPAARRCWRRAPQLRHDNRPRRTSVGASVPRSASICSRGDAPDRVHDVVRPRHENSARCRGRVDQLGERGVRAVRQQHVPGLRVQGCDVAHAVVLLVRPRALVAPDQFAW